MRALLVLVPVTLFLLLATTYSFEAGLHLEDDGYVCLRVADNLRSGQGLGFNPGGPRQPLDSPLWVGALTFASLSPEAPLWAQILGLGIATLVLVLMVAVPRAAWIGAAAALFAAMDGLFISRATAGTGEPVAGLYLVLLYAILRGPLPRSGGWTAADGVLAVWAAAAPLVRAELVLPAVLVTLGAGLRQPRRAAGWLAFGVALGAAGLALAVRWVQFGPPALLANGLASPGAIFAAAGELADIALRRPILLLGTGIVLSEWLRGRLWMGRRVGLAWGVVAYLGLALVGAGGYVVTQVATVLPLGMLMATGAVWRHTQTRPALVAALLLLLAQPDWTRVEVGSGSDTTEAYARIGGWLRQHALPGTVVGAERVGALGYHSGLRVEDTGGMRTLLRHEPDLVLLRPGDPVPPSDLYVPNDDAIPDVIRGPFRIYRWAGREVWREGARSAALGAPRR